ncbi:MAG: NADP-dependent methylenetetrahydromethanopterin/methylenetetrahydrofolate dehydrogenase [Gemmatales bacterium]|nr:NADP-dependent methylenetetrahydromethanopterin/methylenetetrahydrofolate dehydrogenase [Gemmatales bacterium]MDW8223470.1 NADP-dependent methylenetetrahydromethanopterin/methylenetetrahydrofolate dehydrogenase [Gemmatales bacterium]
MSTRRRILIQLDTDAHPSVFDSIVALDAGAEVLLRYGNVRPENVVPLVHGAIFTRGPKDLHQTAIFIGGSDVALAERIRDEVRKTLLPQWGLSVSSLLDPNGSNTTAAAAVRTVLRRFSLNGASVLILGGTGPVGQRIAHLIAQQGAEVRLASRQLSKAEEVVARLRSRLPAARLVAGETATESGLREALRGCQVVFGSGAAGVRILPKALWLGQPQLRILLDLNAVPPSGIEGVEPLDDGIVRDGVLCFGAIAVGNLKMKIHKTAIAKLFERSDYHFDIDEIFALSETL